MSLHQNEIKNHEGKPRQIIRLQTKTRKTIQIDKCLGHKLITKTSAEKLSQESGLSISLDEIIKFQKLDPNTIPMRNHILRKNYHKIQNLRHNVLATFNQHFIHEEALYHVDTEQKKKCSVDFHHTQIVVPRPLVHCKRN